MTIGGSELPNNQLEHQGESLQDCSKTRNDVGGRDTGREESATEVGYGGNEDVRMDVWSHKVGQNKERIREGQRKWEKYPRMCRK